MSVPPVAGSPLGEPGLPDEFPDLDEPTDAELLGLWPDPFAGPPDGEDAWLGGLSLPELDALAEQWAAERGPAAAREAIGAGFTRDIPGEPPGGFAAGGPLDLLPPDPVLAGFAEDAYLGGLGGLGDDELVGMLCATRRLSSWQAAMEFAAVAELDARRRAQAKRPESSRVHEHVGAELAAALTLTGRSADALLGLSRDLVRLPEVLAALFAGRIDRARAAVFAAELAELDLEKAAAIVAALIRAAERMTTGQLRARLRAMVLSADPGAARKRADRGRDDARVESWQENSGNGALAGRELPAADAIAADKRITAIARALQAAGLPGSMDQIRAAVFTALLTGRDPSSLLPAPGSLDLPAPPLTGSVNLTMPASAWFGSSDAPGEVAGFGPLDADTCRDLANRLAADPGTPWCLTLTDENGRAVAHGCARCPPAARSGSPPNTTGPPAWLASAQIHWLERDPCGHSHRTESYRPTKALRHLIEIRHRTCGFPGCRRPARRCDDDHTVPFDQGGLTCECNLAPLCRYHHRCKQAQGWHLTQPQPGILTWTAPHGRAYTTHPEPYPV